MVVGGSVSVGYYMNGWYLIRCVLHLLLGAVGWHLPGSGEAALGE